ncbi:FxsA family protein [Paenibacillus xylaniclasticus]|uniref:FxsA family protein n=1 Tax=Paenibacillus xylaniclasticus TaxID=588083 RepID=UPI001773AC84|nr:MULTISPECIES: FxsA family protein [Paenibacillus]GFN33828.1 UPF0716 protein YtzA [Paenibacillus curdlanolyticus]
MRNRRNWMLAFLIMIPLFELWLIVQVGDWLGGGTAFLLLLAGGVGGFYLARMEGRKAWIEVQNQIRLGQPPGHAMLDGLCILLGGILLMIPGFLSDIVGLTLLFPFTRPLYRRVMLRFLERRMRGGGGGGGVFRIYW